MKIIILDGAMMTSKESVHKYIQKQFDFPDYYGENLDALWDLLTTTTEEICVKIKNKDTFLENMGEYGEAILDTFLDATIENKQLYVKVI